MIQLVHQASICDMTPYKYLHMYIVLDCARANRRCHQAEMGMAIKISILTNYYVLTATPSWCLEE